MGDFIRKLNLLLHNWRTKQHGGLVPQTPKNFFEGVRLLSEWQFGDEQQA